VLALLIAHPKFTTLSQATGQVLRFRDLWAGESEAKLRQLFASAAAAAPAILFIDEIDAIAPKRESVQREMERRIVAQMLTCMDDLFAPAADPSSPLPPAGEPTSTPAATPPQHRHVVVLGATNRPDALDGALRRAGRFDREVSLGIPTLDARRAILAVLCRGLRLDGAFDFDAIARATPGYVGADLAALTKEAASSAVGRIFDALSQRAATAAARELPVKESEGDVDMEEAQVAAGGKARHSDGQGAASAVSDAEQHTAATLSSVLVTPYDGAQPGGAAGASQALPPGRCGAPRPSGREAGVGRREPLSPEELEGLAITMADFEVAVSKVQPSVRREGFTTKPDVTWADVVRSTPAASARSFRQTNVLQNMGVELHLRMHVYASPLTVGCFSPVFSTSVSVRPLRCRGFAQQWFDAGKPRGRSGRAELQHHAADSPSRALPRAWSGGCVRGTPLWAAGMRQDARREGRRGRVRGQLHLHQRAGAPEQVRRRERACCEAVVCACGRGAPMCLVFRRA
jgi:hypothetical protein